MSRDVVLLDEVKPAHKAAITNGWTLLPGVDGRSTWARRLRDLTKLHLRDLGCPRSVSVNLLIRRVAVLTVELERLESKFANAGGADPSELDLYQRTVGSLRRLLASLSRV